MKVIILAGGFGAPTYTFDLPRMLVGMCEIEKYSYYRMTDVEVTDENTGCKTGCYIR